MSSNPIAPCRHGNFANGRCLKCGGRKRENIVGQKFGMLTVIEMLPNFRVRVQCDCGTVKTTVGSKVKTGRTFSCGCFKDNQIAATVAAVTIHGHAGGKRTGKTYICWDHMIQRCTNERTTRYADYGGRGIKVCMRWMTFENFLADMGERPSAKHSIDRFPDKNGNYEPGNCRWATQAEQTRNTRRNVNITFNGRTMCLTDWSKELGIPFKTLSYRIKNWPIERAFTERTQKRDSNRQAN